MAATIDEARMMGVKTAAWIALTLATAVVSVIIGYRLADGYGSESDIPVAPIDLEIRRTETGSPTTTSMPPEIEATVVNPPLLGPPTTSTLPPPPVTAPPPAVIAPPAPPPAPAPPPPANPAPRPASDEDFDDDDFDDFDDDDFDDVDDDDFDEPDDNDSDDDFDEPDDD